MTWRDLPVWCLRGLAAQSSLTRANLGIGPEDIQVVIAATKETDRHLFLIFVVSLRGKTTKMTVDEISESEISHASREAAEAVWTRGVNLWNVLPQKERHALWEKHTPDNVSLILWLGTQGMAPDLDPALAEVMLAEQDARRPS